MTAQHHGMFLSSIGDSLFPRPDRRHAGRRAQRRSRMAAGHREAARSVLDRGEYGGRLDAGGWIKRNDLNGCYVVALLEWRDRRVQNSRSVCRSVPPE